MKERRTIAERVATDYQQAKRVPAIRHSARAARDHQLTPGDDESNMKRPPVSRGCGRTITARELTVSPRLPAQLYDVLPPTTAIVDSATGLQKLSANEQFLFCFGFGFDDAQTAVSL